MNMQISTTFAAAAFFVSSAALAETRSFDLSAFDEIHVSSGIKAEIVVGGAAISYIKHRNAQVPEFDRVMTAEHLKTLFAKKQEQAERWLCGAKNRATHNHMSYV